MTCSRATVLSAVLLACRLDAAEEGSGAAALTRPEWSTQKRFTQMAPHPRLFVSAEQIARMVKGRGEAYAEVYETVAAAAETGVRDAEEPMVGIGALDRSVLVQGRLASMAIQWYRTRDRRYPSVESGSGVQQEELRSLGLD